MARILLKVHTIHDIYLVSMAGKQLKFHVSEFLKIIGKQFLA